jgi:hypothetical protein
LKNNSTKAFYPNMRFEIVSVESTGNSVRVANADNGGDGVNKVAVFDYSQLIGAALSPGAESGNKTIRFTNPNTILFTFTARVKAHVLTGSSSSATSGTGGDTSGTSSGTSGSGDSTNSAGGLSGVTKLLKFTVNPLTKTVSVSLL